MSKVFDAEPVDRVLAGIVTNHEGRSFSVVVLPAGLTFVGKFDRKDGRGFTDQTNDRPVVAFYDRSYMGAGRPEAWQEHGQPTGAIYYLETLREGSKTETRPLSLVGHEPAWTITADNVREAVAMADVALAEMGIA